MLPHTLFAALLLSPAFASPLPFADLGAREETQRRAWDLDARDLVPVSFLDYSVPLTYPTAGVVWQAGGQGYIAWNATLPAGISSSEVPTTARLVLGYTSSGSVGLNLDTDNPLGIDIPLYTAPYTYSFTVPADLPTRTTYILSFQGSSGNISPEFTISGTTVASSTSASTSSIDFVSQNPATSTTPAEDLPTSVFSSSLVALVPTSSTTSDVALSTQTLDATSTSTSDASASPTTSSTPSSSQTSSPASSSSSSSSGASSASASASGTVSPASPVVNTSAAGTLAASSALVGLAGLVALLVL